MSAITSDRPSTARSSANDRAVSPPAEDRRPSRLPYVWTAIGLVLILSLGAPIAGPARGIRTDIARQRALITAQLAMTKAQLALTQQQLELTRRQLDLTTEQQRISAETLATARQQLAIAEQQLGSTQESLRMQRQVLAIAEQTLEQARQINRKTVDANGATHPVVSP
jgi:septal ring factor EnvC (AmiA/AmiB activator)